MLAQIDEMTGKSYYYLYNGHGDVVQITDTQGNIKNTYDYDVWGNFLEKDETIENPFTYFGQTYDEVTGLYYLRARYYDPTTGRFTQQDPAKDGYNWYVYGNQNPIIYGDENGYRSKEAADKIIKDNAQNIKNAASKYGVNPGILAATIYAEQRLNVDWVDDLTDCVGYVFDTSIGVAQAKVSTAVKMEDLGYVNKSSPLIVNGTEYITRFGIVAMNLSDDAKNIMYAAAYLHIYKIYGEKCILK